MQIAKARSLATGITSRVRLCLLIAAAAGIGCGDRITPAQVEELSLTVSDVMIAIQHGADSAARATIADSVARAHDFDGWNDVRDEIGLVATEPEKLRTLLDTTQRRIEARANTAMMNAPALDSAAVRIDSTRAHDSIAAARAKSSPPTAKRPVRRKRRGRR